MLLIPARDEGPRVAAVIAGARAALPGVPVVVVVNGCTDDTAERAERAGATVVHSEPGYARALQVGYRTAVARWDGGGTPRWLVQLDADGQHPTAALPALVAGLSRADLVIGSRFAPGGSGGAGARAAAIQLLGLWTSLLLGQRIRDVTSGLQALAEPLVRIFAAEFPETVADANVLVRAARQGFRITEVPVAMAPRRGGAGMHRGWRSVGYAGRVAGLAAREAWPKPPSRG